MTELESLRDEIQVLSGQVTRLTTLMETEGARCPYRETIAVAANNKKRLDGVEKRLRSTELRIAAISGVSGGGVAAAVMFIGKALGWV